jgi:PAS domain S-box-containing protein
MSRPTILVVDDDRAAARELETELRRLGYRVAGVASAGPTAVTLADAVESVADAVVVTDPDGTVTVFNPAAEMLTGWCRHEVIGRNLGEVLSLTRGPLAGEGAVVVDRSGSKIEVEDTISCVCDSDGRAAGTVTVLRRPAPRPAGGQGEPAGSGKACVEGDCRQADKLREVALFAARAAHDFNNQLTVISGYSNLVLAQLPTGSPIAGMLNEIARAADRAAALTRQLLAHTRNGADGPMVQDSDAEGGDPGPAGPHVAPPVG